MLILSRFKISGHSMMPLLKPGQEIIVSSLPYWFINPKINDLAAFKDENEFIIKRIKESKNGKYLMVGDNKKDSKEYGWIERKQIIGKVIYVLS